VHEALETFRRNKFRVLPVTDENSNVSGVVTLEDLGYVDVNRQDIDVCDTVMHKPALMGENVTLQHVAEFMVETQEDHVFVVDEQERLIGVISGIDVVRKILDLLS
jgi:CBS domain-containing protein